jgi:hypothetical protein
MTLWSLFALRIGVLEELGKDCDRAEEMLHCLERHDFQLVEPGRRDGEGVFSYELSRHAKRYGLDGYRASNAEHVKGSIPSRTAPLFRDPYAFLVVPYRVGEGHSVLDSVVRCHAPAARVDALDALRDRVARMGAAARRVSGFSMRVDEVIELTWLRTRAQRRDTRTPRAAPRPGWRRRDARPSPPRCHCRHPGRPRPRCSPSCPSSSPRRPTRLCWSRLCAGTPS